MFGGRNGLLGLLRLQAGRGGAGFLNELSRLGIGFEENFLALRLSLAQLRFYLLAVGQTLGDELTSLFQHPENRLISKPVKKGTNDAEADDLGNQMSPVHPENFG